MPSLVTNILLIGPPGCGKTSVGQTLAQALACEFIDLDTLCEQQSGQSISDIFQTHGEAWFRQLETEVLKQACQMERCVIATGGGVVMTAENRDCLKKQKHVVFLDASVATQIQRIGDDTSRPLISDLASRQETLQNLYAVRKPLYEQLATLTIATEQLTTQAITDKIILSLQNGPTHE